MAQKKIVHVVGTGTIGEPLIGILCTFKEQFGVDEVTFHKRTPLLTDRSKVMVLCNRGAQRQQERGKLSRRALIVRLAEDPTRRRATTPRISKSANETSAMASSSTRSSASVMKFSR